MSRERRLNRKIHHPFESFFYAADRIRAQRRKAVIRAQRKTRVDREGSKKPIGIQKVSKKGKDT